MRKKVIISVDGPLASGKGTVSRALAKQLNFAYLDTGLLYRWVACTMLEKGLDLEDQEAATAVARTFNPGALTNDPKYRTEAVAQGASKVSQFSKVRDALLAAQRCAPAGLPEGVQGLILDGRDIGTVVFPQADVKFYVTASEEERAQRRWKELQNKGQSCILAEVLGDLQERDTRDSLRAVSPLKAADDAFTIDTTGLEPDAIVTKMSKIVRQKIDAS